MVEATINDEGKLVLSNSTGATIKVEDNSATAGAYDGGSGFFGDLTSPKPRLQTGFGFVKLTSLDGTPVRIEQGNIALSSAGTTAGVQLARTTLKFLVSVRQRVK